MFVIKDAVIQAQERIKIYLHTTPLIYAHQLSQMTKANVYLKLENMQPTAAFKVRGAFNKLLSLTAEEKLRGVVTASTGNHGAAVAYAGKKLAIPCEIYVPKTASTSKINAIKSYGVNVQFYGEECGEAEQYARQYAKQHNKVYVSPYNDEQIIAGQGTIGYELLQQQNKIDIILAAVGGGGLIAGIAGYVKSVNENIRVIGCLPENSPVIFESVKKGKMIEMQTKPTLSDATAGNNDLDTITFPLCQRYVDDYILTSEDEIKAAMRLLMEKERLLIEGAVGVATAALLKIHKDLTDLNIVVVVSGANISLETLKKVVC